MPIAERECHRPGSASIAMHVLHPCLHPCLHPARMTEDACRLDDEQRRLVEATIAEHCAIRGWTLYAVNCRSNHVHVVVAASPHPDEVRDQFKAWCTRRLKTLEVERTRRGSISTSSSSTGGANDDVAGLELKPIRTKWWTEWGSGCFVNDEDGLEAVIHYVCEGQDRRRER